MSLYFTEFLKFTKNNNIKTKRRMDGKINLYLYFINCGFKKLETTDEEELADSLKISNCKYKT